MFVLKTIIFCIELNGQGRHITQVFPEFRLRAWLTTVAFAKKTHSAFHERNHIEHICVKIGSVSKPYIIKSAVTTSHTPAQHFETAYELILHCQIYLHNYKLILASSML